MYNIEYVEPGVLQIILFLSWLLATLSHNGIALYDKQGLTEWTKYLSI